MKLALALLAVGVAQAAWGWTFGLAGAPLIWSGVACCIVGAGYAGLGPRVFGKRPDGSRSPVHVVVLLPFLLGTWIAWRLVRVRRGACCQRIAEGLWLGRRPLSGELPREIAAVLDLTSEFPKSPDVGARAYRCHPLLDATAPHAAAMTDLVEWIDAQSGPVYVHCAAGKGRSTTVVAAFLLARKLADDESSAMAIIRAARPIARLNRAQARALRDFARTSSEERRPRGRRGGSRTP